MSTREKEEAARETLKLFEESLKESEVLGEQVAMDRLQMVDLDRKRNSNREALAALKKDTPLVEEVGNEPRTWFCTGSIFLRLPQSQATSLIRNDQATLDSQIREAQEGLKVKIQRLQEIEEQARDVLGEKPRPHAGPRASSFQLNAFDSKPSR